MGTGLLRWASLALVCLLRVREAAGGPSSPQGAHGTRNVTQRLYLSPYRTLKSVLLGRHHAADQLPTAHTNPDAGNDRSGSNLRVSLPPLPCSDDLACRGYSDPRLECREGHCTCRPPYCWTYRYEAVSVWTAKYIFECGSCGVLGSSCNQSISCHFPGECWRDGFCHCPRGENDGSVCVTTNTNWSLRIAMIGMGIIMLFAFLLLLWNCYQDPPCGRSESSCFGLFSRNQRDQQQHASSSKTPAYTIQAHYYNRQELREPTRSGRAPETRPDEAAGSALPVHDAQEDSGRRPHEGEERCNVEAEAERSKAPPLDDDSSSPTGSCSHVRCELCLPRGPGDLPAGGGAAAGGSDGPPQVPHLQARGGAVGAGTAVASTSL